MNIVMSMVIVISFVHSISLNSITVQILHNQSGNSREIVIYGASGGYIIVSQSFLLKPAVELNIKSNCLLQIK